MGNCAIDTLSGDCKAPLLPINTDCAPFVQHLEEGVGLILEQIGRVGHRLFVWLKIISRDLSAAFSSVNGLSTMLYLAESINSLALEVSNLMPSWGTPFKPFDKSQFDSVVWVTRIFTEPHYYIGGGLESDIRAGRVFAVAYAALGTVWNVGMFSLWLLEQGFQEIGRLASLISQWSCLRFARGLQVCSLLSGIAILSYVCLCVERVREIFSGDHVLFAVVDAIADLLEAASETLALVQFAVPLPAAILQAAAAGAGAASYFLDPFVQGGK